MAADSFTASFLDRAGAKSKHIRVLEPAGRGRGVYSPVSAIKDLGKNPLATIPCPLILTANTCLQSDIVCRCVAMLDEAQASEATLLSLFLVTERARGAESQWAWYLEALPQQGSNGLYLTEDDLDALADTPVAAAVSAKLRHLQALHGLVERELSAWKRDSGISGSVDFGAFKWASFIVLSRAISMQSFLESPDGSAIPGDGYVHEGCNHALVPFLDMFNHSEQPTAYWALQPDGSVAVLKNDQPIDPSHHVEVDGEQYVELHFCYGHNPSTEWVYAHGFVPKGNKHDAWPYFPRLHGSDGLVRVKMMWVAELGLTPRVSFPDPSSSTGLARPSKLTMCLACLDDDPSSKCAEVVGNVTFDAPYFAVNDTLVDDDDLLLQLPGLLTLAVDHACCSLAETADSLRSHMSRAPPPSPVVRDYLETSARLLGAILSSLRNH